MVSDSDGSAWLHQNHRWRWGLEGWELTRESPAVLPPHLILPPCPFNSLIYHHKAPPQTPRTPVAPVPLHFRKGFWLLFPHLSGVFHSSSYTTPRNQPLRSSGHPSGRRTLLPSAATGDSLTPERGFSPQIHLSKPSAHFTGENRINWQWRRQSGQERSQLPKPNRQSRTHHSLSPQELVLG